MSSLAPRCLALLLATALAAPVAAAGQQTEEELVLRLETLLPMLQQAKLEAGSARADYEARMKREQATEQVQIGPLHVVVAPGESAPAQDVVGTVWQRDYAPFVDRSPSLDRGRIFFQWALEFTPYEAPSSETLVVQRRRWKSHAFMEREVQRALGSSLRADLAGTHFQSTWADVSVSPPGDPERLYRVVAVTPSVAVRECLLGDATACLAALGLQTDGYPIDDWYDADERVHMLRAKVGAARFAEAMGNARAEDFPQRTDAVLHEYAEQSPDIRWAAPLGSQVRASLLWYALQQGGTGAWGRLLDAAEGTPLSALESASGQDGTTLVLGWKQWLSEQRPLTHAGLGSLTLGALFWTLLLVTLAARSTRWRFA